MSKKVVHRILVVAEGGLNFEKDDYLGLYNMLDEVTRWHYDDGTRDHHFALEMRLLKEFGPQQSMVQYLVESQSQPGKKFDQLWLFGKSQDKTGVSSQAISDADVALLDGLMRNGLGVFATGDHEEIGGLLCGNIPRVRFLRRWNRSTKASMTVPNVSGPLRVDTRSPPLFVTKSSQADDVDSTPKTIWSRNAILDNGLPSGVDPHPLCFHPDFRRLSFLPDHMHEGVCCEPLSEDEPNALMAADFPAGSRSHVVAWAVKGGYFKGHPAEPQIHPILSCFDLPNTNMGRVVTDSTFHHWTWGNIAAINNAADHSVAWDHIRQYPKNVAAWLARIEFTRSPALELAADLQLQQSVLDSLRTFVADRSDANLAALGDSVVNVVNRLKLDVDKVEAYFGPFTDGTMNARMKLGKTFAATAQPRGLLGLRD
jgi:hypothetical protein